MLGNSVKMLCLEQLKNEFITCKICKNDVCLNKRSENNFYMKNTYFKTAKSIKMIFSLQRL